MILPWHQEVWQQLNRARVQGRLPHALLLAGPEGGGKHVLAHRLAGALLCQRPDDEGRACGRCAACGWLQAGTHPDLLALEPQETGKAIKVDQVRELCTELGMTSHGGRHKIAIVRPADAMNVNAANSLLKTLEEPADDTLLVLVSSAPGRLPATIRSRCQQMQVALPQEPVALAWLQQAGMEPDVARRALWLARGAVLNAGQLADEEGLQLHDRCLDELRRLRAGEVTPTELAKAWSGEQERRILAWWLTWVQELVRWIQAGKPPADPETARNLQDMTETVDCRQLFDLYDRLSSALDSLGSGLNRQLVLEDLLISWSRTGHGGSKRIAGNR